MTVTLGHWGRAGLIAAATGAAADHTLRTAIIVGSFGFASVVVGPFVTNFLTNRRQTREIDHRKAELDELLTLAESVTELKDLHDRIKHLEAENARLRRR